MPTIMRHTVLETSLLKRSQNMKKFLLAVIIGLSLVAVSGRASAQAPPLIAGTVKGTVTRLGRL